MYFVLIFVLTLILQIGFLPGLFPTIAIPELFLPLIIAIAIMCERKEACIFALVAGLVLDFYFIKGFGARTLLFFALAYFLSGFAETFTSRSVFVVLTLTLLAGTLYQFLYFLIINAVGEGLEFQVLLNSIFSLEIPIMMIYSIFASRFTKLYLVRR